MDSNVYLCGISRIGRVLMGGVFIAFISCGDPIHDASERVGDGTAAKNTPKQLVSVTIEPCPKYWDSAATTIVSEGAFALASIVDKVDRFTLPLRAKPNSLGYIRIRSDPSCFEVACRENVIGTIPSCTVLYGYGPLKSSKGSAGIAYAVVVSDSLGILFKCYVSHTVVDILANRPLDAGLK